MNYAEKFKNITLKAEPLILGIESSCDETAAAVVQGRKLLSSIILSSAAEKAKYGGVVPEIASRANTRIGQTYKRHEDAPEHLGAYIRRIQRRLAALGYESFCTFEHGEPHFHKLEE